MCALHRVTERTDGFRVARWILTYLLLSPPLPSNRETAEVSFPDLNGEQIVPVAATAVPNARETALVSPPDLNGKQRAPVADTKAHMCEYTHTHVHTHAFSHSHT